MKRCSLIWNGKLNSFDDHVLVVTVARNCILKWKVQVTKFFPRGFSASLQSLRRCEMPRRFSERSMRDSVYFTTLKSLDYNVVMTSRYNNNNVMWHGMWHDAARVWNWPDWGPNYSLAFLPRCMECSRGITMGILSVCPSVCLSNACIVTKRKKDMFWFLYHTKEHLS